MELRTNVGQAETKKKPAWFTIDNVTRPRDDVPTVDACYLRAVSALHNGDADGRDLVQLAQLRSDDELISSSAIDPSGRHIDALILALLSLGKDSRL